VRLKVILIIISILAISFSIATEIRFLNFRKSMESSMNRLSNNINTKFESVNNDIAKIDNYFVPGGIVEKYIVANSFLKNQMDDLENILTYYQDADNSGYIQIFVTGSKDVWCAFKNEDDKYIFQGNLKPGLNPYKFYFFKSPSIETKYTYQTTYNASFQSGDTSKIYFLIHEPGQSKIRKHPDSAVKNLKDDFNLYIPTVTGN